MPVEATLETQPTVQEGECALRQMMKNKTVGPDDLPAELLARPQGSFRIFGGS